MGRFKSVPFLLIFLQFLMANFFGKGDLEYKKGCPFETA